MITTTLLNTYTNTNQKPTVFNSNPIRVINNQIFVGINGQSLPFSELKITPEQFITQLSPPLTLTQKNLFFSLSSPNQKTDFLINLFKDNQFQFKNILPNTSSDKIDSLELSLTSKTLQEAGTKPISETQINISNSTSPLKIAHELKAHIDNLNLSFYQQLHTNFTHNLPINHQLKIPDNFQALTNQLLQNAQHGFKGKINFKQNSFPFFFDSLTHDQQTRYLRFSFQLTWASYLLDILILYYEQEQLQKVEQFVFAPPSAINDLQKILPSHIKLIIRQHEQ